MSNAATSKFLVFILFIAFGLSGCSSEMPTKFGKFSSALIEIELTPASHFVKSRTTMNWAAEGADTLFVLMNKSFKNVQVEAVGVEADKIKLYADETSSRLATLTNEEVDSASYAHLALLAIPVDVENPPSEIKFSYEGEIYDDVEVASFSRQAIADETTGLVDEKGAFLVPFTGFYPFIPGDANPMMFDYAITVPEAWVPLAEGKVLGSVDNKNGTVTTKFNSEHPIDGSHLIAGPYVVQTIEEDGLEVAFYGYANSGDLAERYLNGTMEYVKQYSELLGEYQFSRFSVVENFFPTGYGMPTFTLLGSQVIRLPFILYTSLGHEVAHNWWGNAVYVDYESGNWCEGLTTYCADYRYKEMRSAEDGRSYRLNVNRDYTDYIVNGDEDDFPLASFTSRTTPGSRTIGYGKSMMVFHMIRTRIGDDLFWSSLREVYVRHLYKNASWTDFLDVFGEKAGENFSWVKKDWIERPGAPLLTVGEASYSEADGKHLVEFAINQIQESAPFRMDIPVRVSFADGNNEVILQRDVTTANYAVKIETDQKPTRIEVDPNMDLFRVLHIEEAPPTLAGFFAEESPVIVTDGSDGSGIQELLCYQLAVLRKQGEQTAT